MIKNTRIKKTAKVIDKDNNDEKSCVIFMPIFILALFSQHECLISIKYIYTDVRNITNITLKRLRIRLIKEFKEESEKFKLRGIKFKYDDLHSVWLSWSMYGGRSISLRHDLSKTVKDYRRDYTDVPVPILRASIKFFKDKIRMEEKKKLEKENFHNYASWLTNEKTRKRHNTGS